MSRADLVVRGGSVYLRSQLVEADVVVVEGRIVAIVDRATALESLAIEADREIDATGLAVLPGAIDTHTHSREPGYTHKEDFETVSRAAAVGGVTTFVDMPMLNRQPTPWKRSSLSGRQRRADASSTGDTGRPGRRSTNPETGRGGRYRVQDLSGVWCLSARPAPRDERRGRFDCRVRAIAWTGLPCLVHPFNQALFDRLSEEAFAEGQTAQRKDVQRDLYDGRHLVDGRAHALGPATIDRCETSPPAHARGQSLRLIRHAKQGGSKVTCEIDPKYYHFTLEHLERLGARMVPGGFVTADDDRMAEIWRSLQDGTVDNIGTDHAPHTLDEVAVADIDAWNANLGSPQIEWVYPVVLTDVAAGRHSLSRAVELLCENPAKMLEYGPGRGRCFPDLMQISCWSIWMSGMS